MRIVSLLPSLTELVCFLGRRTDLVGVTHECDYPTGVETLPHLTRSRIPSAATSAEIDRLVSEQGGSLYDLDADLLAALKPDLILTQAQCDVCAVNEKTVKEVAGSLPGSPHVETVNPLDLAGVMTMFLRVGELLDASEAARKLVSSFESAQAELSRRRENGPPVKVALLEWLDPLFIAGHWNPDLISLAGGVDILGRSGRESRRASFAELKQNEPEALLIAPCGFTLDRVEAEWSAIAPRPEWQSLEAVRSGRVVLADGSAYFSRPGPRLLESLGLAAVLVNPETNADLAPRAGWKKISVQS
ncbi:MAG TPA: ABC transporter substrate-binding protein [Isosphaeraceae bacterium]|nr:ABC transporter substrate-binding protein [Isosphaeraceae bacterium]